MQDSIHQAQQVAEKLRKVVEKCKEELEDKQLTFELVQDKDSKARF
jgi:hypothetical protein